MLGSEGSGDAELLLELLLLLLVALGVEGSGDTEVFLQLLLLKVLAELGRMGSEDVKVFLRPLLGLLLCLLLGLRPLLLLNDRHREVPARLPQFLLSISSLMLHNRKAMLARALHFRVEIGVLRALACGSTVGRGNVPITSQYSLFSGSPACCGV